MAAPEAAAAGPQPPPPESPPVLRRLRSSILGKVLGALVVVMVVSTSVTALVDARLTHSAVASQTQKVARSNLLVLQEAFIERQQSLVTTMRTLADDLVATGLTDPSRRAQLIGRLGAVAQSNQLDLLDVVNSRGTGLDPPVGVGRLTATLPIGGPAQPFTTEPTSRLLSTMQGKFVQAVPMPVGPGPDALVLVGGHEFGDTLAYRLRRQVGNLPEVILVAGTRVAGSTLPVPLQTPPNFGRDGRAPRTPQVARIGGEDSVVTYVAVGRSAQDPVGGALGIALPDPAVALDRALAMRRLLAGTLLAVLAVALGWFLFRVLTQPLVTLARTAVRIAGGHLEEPFVAQGSDEVARLAGALEHMRQELRAKLALVADQANELQVSSQRIVAAQDEERRRLARDLHDGIQQQLVVLRLRLGLAQEAAPDAETRLLSDLGSELDSTIASLREVSHDLYPAILRDRGLAAAVRSYAGRLPLSTTLTVTPDPLPRLSPEVESAAYFLLCEAVTNVIKHADPTEVRLSLSVDGADLKVQVVDDGRGFEGDASRHQGGVLHMDDRVRSFGGSLNIQSAPGAGTVVEASFPLAGPNGGPPEPAAPEQAAVAVSPSGAEGRTALPQPGDSYPAPR